jgi:hypothetical protein
MGAGTALLDPADVQGGGGEVGLVPAQVRQLAGPEAVPVGHKDHGGVPVPQRLPLVALSSRSTSASVRYSRVTQAGVGRALPCNCSIYGARRHQLQM